MAQKIIPNLWFDRQAEEAAGFYTSIFRNSRIGRARKSLPGLKGPGRNPS
jgi:predicted 3-demethylubiquinone-9 3-methyltransferase (glyoxalase superfamily)